MWNSNVSSSYIFWVILQNIFCALPQRNSKIFSIRIIYQSKVLIFYFCIKKNWFPNLNSTFLVNRQTKFYALKLWVWAHIQNSNTLDLVCLFTKKVFKIRNQFFVMQNYKIRAVNWYYSYRKYFGVILWGCRKNILWNYSKNVGRRHFWISCV